jgi:hypothetical protein
MKYNYLLVSFQSWVNKDGEWKAFSEANIFMKSSSQKSRVRNELDSWYYLYR